MDPQLLFNVIIGLVLGVGGWFARELWGAVKELQKDVHQLEVDLPSHYVRKDEMSEYMREIREMIQRIYDKLDEKVDKNGIRN